MIAEKWKDNGSIDEYFKVTLVDRENTSQLKKYGKQNRSPEEWMLFLTEEVGELAQAIADAKYRNADWSHIRKESIQIVTLALKISQMCGQ